MKRSLLPALVIGVLVSGLILALHRSGVALRGELALTDLVSPSGAATHIVGEKWQYVFVTLLSLGIGWLSCETRYQKRIGLVLAALIVELLTISWICSLYHTFFQPLPSMLAVVGSFIAAITFRAIARRVRARSATHLFSDRLSRARIAELDRSALPAEGVAKAYEATAVVCDIANKHDLAEETDPATFAAITAEFLAHASARFLEAGAYLESVDGEGVVAIFGLPAGDDRQAETATREALRVVRSFASARADGKRELFGKFDVHLGVSSGRLILARTKDDRRATMLVTGEPVELARRFCIANRFYGSRILIGPRTFELASKAIVARPIDFLSGVDVRERHEIYEPLSPVVDASPEEIQRRDSFWNGVVLYRERRWGEAYTHFQKARGENGDEDLPLQLYLRRLEPRVLQLTEEPDCR
ncbi:MAG: hypothetical protein ABI871_08470 [Chthoniobacterales bacterium]